MELSKMTNILLFFTFLSFSFTFVNGQGSLQADYNSKFTLAEDLRNENEDAQTKLYQAPESRFRLTNTVLPRRYVLTVTPIIDAGFEAIVGDQWTTPGVVDIDVQSQEASAIITLHSANITIYENATKVTSVGAEVAILNQTYVEENSFYIITLASNMVVGQNYSIHIEFLSLISEALNGLYRSSYVDPDTGLTIWLATSQMEALHARQVFPCFDEPALKATFDVTIGRREQHLALFNTESVENSPIEGKPGWVLEKFAETVVMPTYLLAFIISIFTYSEAQNNHLTNKTVRTYAPKHYIEDGGGVYAADVADEMLAHFEGYFGQQYPLSKMDSAAVPDFFFGAMENWGLNIYRETALLYFNGESNEAERFTVTRILGHELAHQWFGNLVTANFWTHIWLNEGFATYVAALSVEAIKPEYQPWERFHNDAVSAAMLFDAQPEVTHSLKIDEVAWPMKGAMDWFDRISYEKGGSLILMMEGFLTNVTLQKGLRRYLEDQKYKAAVQDDLFRNLNVDALADNRLPTGLTIKEIMDTWTLQSHFPLIRVSRAGSTRIFISQETFTNNRGVQPDSSTQNGLWWVPVSIATQDNPNFDPLPELWIDKMIATTTHPVNSNQWIIANAGATGYYRVLYDTQLTNLIKAQLEANHTVISSSTTRMHILDDYFNSAWQRYVSVETAIGLTSYLAKETEIVVWNAVFSNLRRALNLRQDADFRNYLLPKVTGALTLVGGANAPVEPGMDTLRHLQFLDWNCALEGDECKTFALSLYDQWKANTTVNPVRLDIRPMVYCSIVSNGGQEAFDFIVARYNDATISAKQKGFLLNSLGCPREEVALGLLDVILDDAQLQIPKNQRGTLLQRLAMNSNARYQLLTWYRTNIAALNTYFENVNAIVNSISTMATYLGTEADFTTVTALKEANAALLGTRLDTSLRTIRSNIEWNAEFGDQIISYIKP